MTLTRFKNQHSSAESFIGRSTIYGVEGEHRTPYMTRYWIGRLRLHIFYRGDADPDPHNHPWPFWTFPLTSYVEEVTVHCGHRNLPDDKFAWVPSYDVETRLVKAFRLHYRPAEHCHRVLGLWGGRYGGKTYDLKPTVRAGKIITIVWRGAKSNKWGFLRKRTDDPRRGPLWCFTPRRQYVYEGGKEAPCTPREALLSSIPPRMAKPGITALTAATRRPIMKLNQQALDYADDAVHEALSTASIEINDRKEAVKLAIQAYLQSVARQSVPDSPVHRWARDQTRSTMEAFADIHGVRIMDGIQLMIELSHGNSVACGWYDDPDGEPIQRNVGERIALLHSELSEALEGYRKNAMDDHLPDRKSVEVELADLLHRAFDFAGHLGLDLAGAYAEKGRYNLRRKDHTLEHRKAEGGKVF